MAGHYNGKDVSAILGAEARGFIFGSAAAYKMGIGFIPVRKPGKLPFKTCSVSYNLEYGKNIFKYSSSHFAHYIFNRGFGIINRDGAVVYDYRSNNLILQKGKFPKTMKELGLAITQISYQDFIER